MDSLCNKNKPPEDFSQNPYVLIFWSKTFIPAKVLILEMENNFYCVINIPTGLSQNIELVQPYKIHIQKLTQNIRGKIYHCFGGYKIPTGQ